MYTPQSQQETFSSDAINQKLTELFTNYFKERQGSGDPGVRNEANSFLTDPNAIQSIVQRNAAPILAQIQQAQQLGIDKTPDFQNAIANLLTPENFNASGNVGGLQAYTQGQIMQPTLNFSPQYMEQANQAGMVNPWQAQAPQLNPQYNLQTQDYGGVKTGQSFNADDVKAQYKQVLGRDPSQQEISDWVRYGNSGGQNLGAEDIASILRSRPEFQQNQVQQYGQQINDTLAQGDQRTLGIGQQLLQQQFAQQGRELGGSGYINAFAQAAQNLAQGRQQAMANFYAPAYQSILQNTQQQGNAAYGQGQQNLANERAYQQGLGQYNTDWSRQAQAGNTDYARQLQLANAGYGAQFGLANAQLGQSAALANASYNQNVQFGNTDYQRALQNAGLGYQQGIQSSNADYLRQLQMAKLGYGYSQSAAANDAYRAQQAWSAQNSAARRQSVGSGLGGLAGTAIGAYFGGPVGAYAGGSVGSQIGKLF